MFILTAMTKQQLLETVAAATGQSRSEIDRTLEAILEKTSEALASGERVELRGFGIFEVKETKTRTGRNPRTGETVEVPASRKAKFRPSKELKDRLATKVSSTEPPA